MINYYEENRYGAMAVMMTFQSCLGSIAAMYMISFDSTFLLATCAVVTMASNAVFIAQAPANWSVGVFNFSVIVNLILLIAYFLS